MRHERSKRCMRMELTIDERRSPTSMKNFVGLFLLLVLALAGFSMAAAAPFKKLDKPPLTEQWFGIYVDNELVGYYHLKIVETPEGYRMEEDGSASVKVMGFTRLSTSRESYLVGKNLALHALEVEQSINGVFSRLS